MKIYLAQRLTGAGGMRLMNSKAEIEPMVRDLWQLREREDLFHECLDYVWVNHEQKPIVVSVIHFLQKIISRGGMSEENMQDMAIYYYEKDYGDFSE
tara:strand:- start:372 stop:662 length:291 start_codon:yes stop_codon:yes gene_type:complete